MNPAIQFSHNQASHQAIAAHLRQCDAAFVPSLSSRLNIDDYASKIISRAQRFEASASAEHELAGLVAMYCNDDSNDGCKDTQHGRAFITNVSVLPTWQQQGIARALLKQALHYAKHCGCMQVELEVNTNNPTAIALYEKIGFVQHAKANMNTADNMVMRHIFS
ncbi:GNAT family N-acetyltransferase [Undibacterium sp. Ji42W]|uniref:GNAT family N-acetyltransferase n=1 Tax=Undibacterium sp. Ji42W TaxID=3413039 RepID=UPI003BF0D517